MSRWEIEREREKKRENMAWHLIGKTLKDWICDRDRQRAREGDRERERERGKNHK